MRRRWTRSPTTSPATCSERTTTSPSCSSSSPGKPLRTGEHARFEDVCVNLLWHPQAQFAGYLVAQAERLGEARGVALRTTPLDFARGPVDTVLSGAAPFSVASPSHLLESPRADELVLLLAIQQDSALVYPAHRDRGIESLADLSGRRVGVWPGHEDLELRWMLQRAGVDPGRIERVPLKDTVGPFLAGEIDCAQMTVYHELHQVEATMRDPARLRIFRASEHGAALIKDGLITTRRLAETRPAFVQAVVDTVLEGWTRAFADRAAAVRACVSLGQGLEPSVQSRQLDDIHALAYPAGGPTRPLGFPDRAHLERAASAKRALGLPVSAEAERHGIDARFWQAAPSACKPAH